VVVRDGFGGIEMAKKDTTAEGPKQTRSQIAKAIRAEEAKPDPGPKNLGGRPPTHGPEVWDEILRLHSNGKTITEICEPPSMPEPVTVARKAANDPHGFGKAYTRARMMFADAIFDEAMKIADEVPADKVGVARNRLRVDTRLRLVEKLNPEKYGNRLNLHHSGGVDFGQVDDATLNQRVMKHLHEIGLVALVKSWGVKEIQIAAMLELFQTPELPTAAEPLTIEHNPEEGAL